MATFTVTNLFNAGAGSLRNAIFKANGAGSTDIINFDTSLSGGTINLTSGELRIRDDLTINGLGADLLSVDAGGNPFRIFKVADGLFPRSIDVAIKELTITGGNASLTNIVASSAGGGIFNRENLTVTNSTISGNSADSSGGGILNEGNLTITNSTISGNTANFRGGGIDNGDGNLMITNSTISGNTAEYGGGISNRFYSDLTVTNSTISGNSADSGGGISNVYYSDLTIINSTISGNTAAEYGGGIYSYENFRDTATVTSSIIAANTDNQDIGGGNSFTSGGNNLIGNGEGTEGFTNGVNGDLVGTAANPIDPLLGELQNNGGPTQTQALLPGSPAINAGSNPLNLEFDQRGPGFNRVVGAQADVGAYEVVPEPDSTLGVLAVAVLGVVLLRKRQRQRQSRKVSHTADS